MLTRREPATDYSSTIPADGFEITRTGSDASRRGAIGGGRTRVDTLHSIWDKGALPHMTADAMRIRDVTSMDLTDVRAEIELIQTEARRMAPSEAEFLRRFPTMAARLKALLERRELLEDASAGAPRPAQEAPTPKVVPAPGRGARIVGPTRPPSSFLDLREELLEAESGRESRAESSPAALPTVDDGRLRKELAARDAEIRRLREERDDWRSKAEGAEGRISRGAEIARRLEETLRELDELRARVAELESADDGAAELTATTTQLQREVEHLRNEQESMQAAHNQELERVRERHRQEIESWIERENERAQLAERVARLEAELAEARSESQAAHASLASERGRLADELDAARGALESAHTETVAAAAERERLSTQLEAATLDRNVISVGILQAVQRLSQRIEDDPRYAALPENDPVLGEVRRSLFQDLERFAQHTRAIGTDVEAERFLHALGERLEEIPDWIGRLLEALIQLSESSRAVLGARDEELVREVEVREAADARATAFAAKVSELETALDAAATAAREQAEGAASRLEAVDAELATVRTRADSLVAELDAARTRVAALEAQGRADAEARADLEQRARRDEAEVQRLEEALEQTELRKAELESEITGLRTNHEHAQTQIVSLERSVTEAEDRATRADREALELGNALAEVRAKVQGLEQTIERAASDLSAALTNR